MSAPTPGPLDSESVKLLVKGDLLLCKTWGVVRFDRFDDSGVRAFVLDLANDQVRLMKPINMAFIGRPGPDGWVPWSGGENPAPGQMVDFDDGTVSLVNCLSDIFDVWEKPGRFRLAPTAPVEASGSEREHGPKCWGKTSISDEMMYCYCGSTDSPPGETREALDRLKMAAHVYEDDEMAADCATLEALLSARPLALGGQQGDA